MRGPLRAIVRALGIPVDSAETVLALTAMHACLGAALAVAETTVLALFLGRSGADRLPIVLLSRAVLTPALAAFYSRASRGKNARSVFAVMLVLGAGACLASSLLVAERDVGPIAAMILQDLVASILTVHWGVTLLAELEGEGARRSVAIVYAGSRGGAAIAGAIMAGTSAWLGAASGFVLAASLFVLGALATRLAPGKRGSIPPPTASRDTGRAVRLLFRSPLLATIAIATVMLVLARAALKYQQQTLLEELGEDELAMLLGVYTAVTNALSIALPLLLVGRLLDRIGVGATNALYAAVVLVVQLAMLFVPGVGVALLARFADGELKHALKSPVSSLFYEPFAKEDRGIARAFILGAVSPAAQVGAALALAALVTDPSEQSARVAAATFAILLFVSALAQSAAYGKERRKQPQGGATPPGGT